MPELPEVETIRRGLEELVVGAKIEAVKILVAKSYRGTHQDLNQYMIGARISQIRRFGKLLVFDLDNGHSFLVHLAMTGQLVFRSLDSSRDFGGGHPSDSFVHRLPDSSTRFIWRLDNGLLFFNDQRIFGYIELVATSSVGQIPFIAKMGPEPFHYTEASVEEFLERINHHLGMPIKGAILDQAIAGGVGNIYADESLWMSEIHPATRVHFLTPEQLRAVFIHVAEVIQTSIDHGGSTSRNYINAKGERGRYLDFANVYGRQGLPCARCGTTIVKIKVAGRGTHICPTCQVQTIQ
ncbi:MAG: bifunctional DNA-formamidopyrimidine glycosylase/DNA-(apurinic or apyrimidinic site) lyase [Bifidobacteriaceae bacterium]|jgi:formamidopyrimidine-DNA glycosylase|nr:bifunctional DNA-formamidopyrimidine glycosylase/DNA-(apurinic or apyrimidinic site) lyase [Bifidobacteriaceae bacterium]